MITFENVTKKYPRQAQPALDDVNVHLDAGEFAFLVGSSGSGKSTLMRLVLCEEKATSGSLKVAHWDVGAMKRSEIPRLRRSVGMVFQDFRLIPEKTVYQNVSYVLDVLGQSPRDIKRIVPEALEMVGLAGTQHRLPTELSGGEQQRVAIARAVVKKPSMLLADEPTGNLDPGTSLDIVRLLDSIHRNGTTVLMATHDHQIVDQLRKRVIELHHGELVRDQARGIYGEQD